MVWLFLEQQAKEGKVQKAQCVDGFQEYSVLGAPVLLSCLMGHCSVVGIWWTLERTAVEMTFCDSTVVDRSSGTCNYLVVVGIASKGTVP